MSKYNWLEFLRHIFDEADFIIRSSNNKKYEDLLHDEIWQRAIIRSLEIIGEATKKIDNDYRNKHPEIEWRGMARMRDKLIHDYFGVDYEIVWEVIQDKIPKLHFQIKRILDENK